MIHGMYMFCAVLTGFGSRCTKRISSNIFISCQILSGGCIRGVDTRDNPAFILPTSKTVHS